MRETRAGAPEVLIVAEAGEAGGIGRYCVDLAALLGKQARVVCLCPTSCEAGTCWLADQCAKHTVQLDRVPMPARGWRTGLAGLVRLWRSSGRPAVHTNGRRGNFLSLAAWLTVPGYHFVTTVHGVLGSHARRNALYRIIDLAAARAASAVIAVSSDTRVRLLKAGSPALRTVVILNGLGDAELTAFRSLADRRRPARDVIRVGFLGRLSREKGTRELLLIARALLTTNATATFAIAGDGPDRAWMEIESRDLTQGGRLTWSGAVRDVPSFLADIDILVIPSHNEGLPYALLEAMASGCAVVASRVGGIPEVLSHPSLGVLVEPGHADEFVRSLIALAADPVGVHAVGQAAAAHVGTHFALRDRHSLLARVYERDLPAAGTSEAPPPIDRQR